MAAQSHTLKLVNDELAIEMITMSKETKKVENVAEKTGETIGRSVKKGSEAVSAFGKGLKKGIKKEE